MCNPPCALYLLQKVVQDFLANIRDRRNKLAPQILELRNTRQKSQAIEQEYQQKKVPGRVASAARSAGGGADRGYREVRWAREQMVGE